MNHCWADKDDCTCLLPGGHDGPHEWTPDSEIVVAFLPDQRPDVGDYRYVPVKPDPRFDDPAVRAKLLQQR
jgi:hypothetical protein